MTNPTATLDLRLAALPHKGIFAPLTIVMRLHGRNASYVIILIPKRRFYWAYGQYPAWLVG